MKIRLNLLIFMIMISCVFAPMCPDNEDGSPVSEDECNNMWEQWNKGTFSNAREYGYFETYMAGDAKITEQNRPAVEHYLKGQEGQLPDQNKYETILKKYCTDVSNEHCDSNTFKDHTPKGIRITDTGFETQDGQKFPVSKDTKIRWDNSGNTIITTYTPYTFEHPKLGKITISPGSTITLQGNSLTFDGRWLELNNNRILTFSKTKISYITEDTIQIEGQTSIESTLFGSSTYGFINTNTDDTTITIQLKEGNVHFKKIKGKISGLVSSNTGYSLSLTDVEEIDFSEGKVTRLKSSEPSVAYSNHGTKTTISPKGSYELFFDETTDPVTTLKTSGTDSVIVLGSKSIKATGSRTLIENMNRKNELTSFELVNDAFITADLKESMTNMEVYQISTKKDIKVAVIKSGNFEVIAQNKNGRLAAGYVDGQPANTDFSLKVFSSPEKIDHEGSYQEITLERDGSFFYHEIQYSDLEEDNNIIFKVNPTLNRYSGLSGKELTQEGFKSGKVGTGTLYYKGDVIIIHKKDGKTEAISINELTNTYANRKGLDPNLVKAQMQQESGFNPLVQSGSDCHGLLQLLSETGNRQAKNMGITNFDIYNPKHNVDVGTTILSKDIARFEMAGISSTEATKMALSRYNGGGYIDAYLQTWLNEKGYNVAVDGDFGEKSQEAMKLAIKDGHNPPTMSAIFDDMETNNFKFKGKKPDLTQNKGYVNNIYSIYSRLKKQKQ